MSEEHSRGHVESGSAGSSRGSTWRERSQKRREDQEGELAEEQSGLVEGSYQTLRTVSGATEHGQHDERDQEIERLHKLVRNFELEGRNRCQQRNQYNRERRDDNFGDRNGEESSQTSSHQGRNHSWESC